jgi:uroporphyrin-III C-methyltransferase/precorrin-2 dehydrogenase/sirohydrochlorin ferrochelatase
MEFLGQMKQSQLSVFPAFFKVEDRVVVIIGEGEEALAKVRLVAETRAAITIVAENPEPALAKLIAERDFKHIAADYRADHLNDAVLVFAATGDRQTDERIVSDARAQKIAVNAVDRPDICDFYTPALVNRAPVAVAIGSEGAGPVLTQIIRASVERLLSPSLGALARMAVIYRNPVEKLLPAGAPRRTFWKSFFTGSVARAVEGGDLSSARREATRLLKASGPAVGHVWLVGAGPGAEDLLTLRAQRVLQNADVIVHDALVPENVVAMGRRDAERIPVGKRKGCHSKRQEDINALLVSLARDGKRVVRLKSGDPLVFGRAGEEMAALRTAEIGYEVVPGITSALAAAATMELPVTLRGVASSLVFTTGHDMKGDVLPDWARLAVSGATIAVYMGKSVAASIAARLIEGGLAGDTTVAVIENASRSDQRMFYGTLRELPALEARSELKGPVMVIIGDAVAGARIENAVPLNETIADAVAA